EWGRAGKKNGGTHLRDTLRTFLPLTPAVNCSNVFAPVVGPGAVHLPVNFQGSRLERDPPRLVDTRNQPLAAKRKPGGKNGNPTLCPLRSRTEGAARYHTNRRQGDR